MLRFINAHRLASVGVAAALALVIVTMSTRNGGAPNPADSAEQPVESADAGEAGTDARPSTTAPVDDGEAVDPSPDPMRLSMPVDPSGARADRTEAGAQQTAIDFAGTVQQRLLYLTDEAATELLAAWSADATGVTSLDAEIAGLSVLRSTLTAGGGGIWWSVSPIASEVEAFDADRARVSVWVSQVVGSSVDPMLGGEAIAPTVDFRITTVDLTWSDADGWSIWNVASTPGPVPMMASTSTMTSPIEFMDTLGSFTLVKEHS